MPLGASLSHFSSYLPRTAGAVGALVLQIQPSESSLSAVPDYTSGCGMHRSTDLKRMRDGWVLCHVGVQQDQYPTTLHHP